MEARACIVSGISSVAIVAMASFATGAYAHPIRYAFGATHRDPNARIVHVGPYQPPYLAPRSAESGKWTDVENLPTFQNGPWEPQLLTDGTVLVLDAATNQWYKLTPDSKGKYTDGTWTAVAAMPADDCPLYFAAQILPDGRLIENGGEYNNCGNSGDSTVGALYNPVRNHWTSVSPPTGWSEIGDAESIILPNGTYMLADCCNSNQALASVKGKNVTWMAQTGFSSNSEEGWTALPGGNVLTVDVWSRDGEGRNYYEVYDTATGTWSLAGHTADSLNYIDEMGPAPLTPSYGKKGTIIQFSANTYVGVNDVYDVASDSWTSGPIMQVGTTIYDCEDAPAATLPDGNVLVQASPHGVAPSHFWETRIGKTGKVRAVQVNDPTEAANVPSWSGNLLLLPTGQVLWDNGVQDPTREVSVYTPVGHPKAAWLPRVTSVSNSLAVGSIGNAISGKNFNGFDLGGVYGDDAQAATNYPLVRITNTSTGDVCFGRSYDFSTMGVWTSGTTNAVFDIPSTCETGASTLQVIVNGIASAGTSVTLQS